MLFYNYFSGYDAGFLQVNIVAMAFVILCRDILQNNVFVALEKAIV